MKIVSFGPKSFILMLSLALSSAYASAQEAPEGAAEDATTEAPSDAEEKSAGKSSASDEATSKDETPTDALPQEEAPLQEQEKNEVQSTSTTSEEVDTTEESAGFEDTSVELEEISLEEWQNDDWELVEPKKRALLEFDGYFRFRADLLQNLGFGNGVAWEDTPRFPADQDNDANYIYSNLRIRVSPTFHVNDQVSIITTFDVLDNLVLGSTPISYSVNGGGAPLNLLNRGQLSPQNGVNALTSAVSVKQAYAKVTALNEQFQLRLGRMFDHFGTGLVANNGQCLNCDQSDVVDRAAVTVNIANHLFTGMFDWIASGPTTFWNATAGQPVDAVDWDDGQKYSLRIERVDSPRKIQERLLQGDTVINYGAWLAYTRQALELPFSYWSGATGLFDAATTDPQFSQDSSLGFQRDANIFLGDLYLKLFHKRFELSVEGALQGGTFNDRFDVTDTTEQTAVTVLSWGGALEAKYKFDGDFDGLELKLMSGGASGDSNFGFGAGDNFATQKGPDGSASGDTHLGNFNFNQNFHVDLLMFRQILGSVSNAWYIAPHVRYTLDSDISFAASVIYSQAVSRASTPGKDLPMGLEIDGEVSYGLVKKANDVGVKGAVFGGVAFPFGAFQNLSLPDADQGGSVAWTLQARMYVTF